MQRIRELDLPVKTSGSTATAIRAALTERELEIFTHAAYDERHRVAHASGRAQPQQGRVVTVCQLRRRGRG